MGLGIRTVGRVMASTLLNAAAGSGTGPDYPDREYW
jgi:hypothetical protein